MFQKEIENRTLRRKTDWVIVWPEPGKGKVGRFSPPFLRQFQPHRLMNRSQGAGIYSSTSELCPRSLGRSLWRELLSLAPEHAWDSGEMWTIRVCWFQVPGLYCHSTTELRTLSDRISSTPVPDSPAPWKRRKHSLPLISLLFAATSDHYWLNVCLWRGIFKHHCAAKRGRHRTQLQINSWKEKAASHNYVFFLKHNKFSTG